MMVALGGYSFVSGGDVVQVQRGELFQGSNRDAPI